MDKTKIDAALGGSWDFIGELIVNNGGDDASGHRRMLMGCVEANNYEQFCKSVPTSREIFDALCNLRKKEKQEQ